MYRYITKLGQFQKILALTYLGQTFFEISCIKGTVSRDRSDSCCYDGKLLALASAAGGFYIFLRHLRLYS